MKEESKSKNISRHNVENYYETIISSMTDLIFIIDLDHRFKQVFASSQEKLLLSPEETIGKKVEELFPRRIISKFLKCSEEVKRTKQSENFQYFLDIGENRYWFSATVNLSKSEKEFVVVVRDITEQKKMEMRLRESESRYRAIVENTDDYIYIVDENFHIILINPNWIQKLGYDPRVTDKKCYECLADLDFPCPDCKNKTVFKGNKIKYVKKMKDGTIFDVYNAPIKQPDGSYLKISIARNITEQLKMEEERIRSQKFESIGLLAGGIAHDFNNALMTLMGNIEVLYMNKDLSKNDKHVLKDMRQLIRKTTGLTNQLLTFAKGGEPVTELVDIKEIISDSINMALKGSNCECITRFPENLPLIRADAAQILQVFNNLLINADQSMKQGGIIEISVIFIEDKLKSGLSTDLIRIDVTDKGGGIPEEIRDKIFVPYFSTKETGHGLGLATCYSIIKRHNGTISFKSKQGIGTTFSVHLPSTDEVFDDIPVEKKSEEEAVEPSRILIMDDMSSVRKSIGKLLERIGFHVDYAINGTQVLEKFKDAKDDGREYEVMLLDLVIPNGMGGKETVKKLKQIDDSIKTIAMTGYSNDPILAHPDKFGFTGALQKPFNLAELKEMIKEATKKE